MSWQHLLRKRFSKTTVWLILFFIMLGAFIFIILDESCTFHVERLISIQTAPSFPKPTPSTKTPDRGSASNGIKGRDEIEAFNPSGLACLLCLNPEKEYDKILSF